MVITFLCSPSLSGHRDLRLWPLFHRDNIPRFRGGGSMVPILRPLSMGELLDRTFYLYRNNFPLFVGITAIPQLVVLTLRLTGAAIWFGRQFIGFNLLTLLVG